ncbi:hypothetical protein [Streptomyces fulvorobeus]|uniref:Uncharacterized protein n=1 Tax=Streptomyces fulvorobeus TaxID=284028 RepID=A0A7Y9HHQ9_9ACTN|nr:hypothetical protein [Streptomyces fulvorobeus]NYE44610.1 hypothetical protein [Streptomyces fulvorobeus]
MRSPVWLNEKNSLSLREDRAGDIRLDCEDDVSCELQSDTSVFMQMFNGKAARLDTCRHLLTSATGLTYRTWTFAAADDGSQLCVKNASGDIAVLTIQIKQTTLREAAFLQLSMHVWKRAA